MVLQREGEGKDPQFLTGARTEELNVCISSQYLAVSPDQTRDTMVTRHSGASSVPDEFGAAAGVFARTHPNPMRPKDQISASLYC